MIESRLKMKYFSLIILLSLMFISCYRFQLFNLNTEEAISKISNGKISIVTGLPFTELISTDGDTYIEVPQLPGGFFLYYRSRESFPTLTHVRGMENDLYWPGDIFDIQRIYFFDESFIVESKQQLYKVRYDYFDYTLVNCLEENIQKEIVFLSVQPHGEGGWFNVAQGLFCFQTGNKVTGFKDIINGVYEFEIGLLGENQKYHIWGESVYGFFDINAETLELSFPQDKTSYNVFIHSYNNRVSRNYDNMKKSRIAGKNKIDNFSVVISKCEEIGEMGFEEVYPEVSTK